MLVERVMEGNERRGDAMVLQRTVLIATSESPF